MAEKIPMGIGNLGFRNLVFKRKFRFTFELEDICGGLKVPKHYIKTAARPNLSIEETELNFLNATTWIPAKAKWQEMKITYIDVATLDSAPLFTWLASVYNFNDPVNLEMGSQRRDYAARAIIKLWDGCGNLIEIWELNDVWPKSVDFGSLEYNSTEEAIIDLSIRYSSVRFTPVCPVFTINPCCSPCSGTSGDTASNNTNLNFG